jgi:hypothetical protein
MSAEFPVLLVVLGFFCLGALLGSTMERQRAERRLLIIDRLCMAARHAASKLRVEIIRRSIEPRAEYENLIEEAEKHKWRP